VPDAVLLLTAFVASPGQPADGSMARGLVSPVNSTFSPPEAAVLAATWEGEWVVAEASARHGSAPCEAICWLGAVSCEGGATAPVPSRPDCPPRRPRSTRTCNSAESLRGRRSPGRIACFRLPADRAGQRPRPATAR